MEQPVEFNWPPLESNPEVFTDYMHKIGLPEDWVVGEVFGLDEDCLSFVPKPVVAVIATFENLKKGEEAKSEHTHAETNYYMKQTHSLDNACGIIACIHSALNNLDKFTLAEGSVLQKFHTAVKDLTPEERATSLEGNSEFQETHKQYAAQGQSNLAATQDDVRHHFIAFVLNSKGQLVELDGVKSGPLVIKDHSEDLLTDAAQILSERVANGDYSESLAVLTLNKKPEE
ncbi:ubiquitin carboxyl-terminal hydrolase isozyme l3 [Stylonychia lemnae]|uniref:Ubiquitin carboxyl-terminal hydrolase n=1 Tax=Stylonychia lemnae TaxID=5949 RepID=A0A078B145_STYLE|nr:ubiquitin carboxyl-terminal hydrolase isozyme l3 [Stylonychia lemnae]|eukprot:CDW88284.1 ubiquitin carboxyl-terminal hydrolase isozyme l3 [Stylonychia lemnae]